MALFKRLLILIALFTTLPCFAVGWVSSGGMLLKDRHNPWFVDRNATDVNYCIILDESSMSASLATVQTQITKAFNFWKREFSRSQQILTMSRGQFKIGNQNFVLSECSKDTDIKFKFGHKALTSEELKWLKDPSTFVGVTVRQLYKPDTLRGSGFVYISGDIGEMPYNNTSGELVKEAWKEPKLLYLALVHEIGHIFGISHVGNALMSESFLNQLLKKKLTQAFLVNAGQIGFMGPADFKVCDATIKAVKNFFGLDSQHKCMGIEFNIIKKEITIKSMADESMPLSEGEVVGKILGIDFSLAGLRAMPMNFLHITAKQKIYSQQELSFDSFLIGPPRLEASASGSYVRFSDFESQELQLEISPSFFRVISIINESPTNVFMYNSPISLGYYFEFGN